VIALLLLAMLLGVGPAPAATTAPAAPAPERPAALAEVDYVQRPGAMLPLDTMLRDEQGRERPLRSFFRGRPVLLVPAYYRCPMLCSLVLGGVARSLRVLDDAEVDVVSFSIDPAETPALAAEKKALVLSEHELAARAGRWHLLTGEERHVRTLADAVGFRYAWDAERGQWAHPAGIVVVTPEGRIARYLFGVEYAPRDVRLALVEASAGRVGSIVDRLLLYCYQYDPRSGAYSMTVLRAVRAGGIVTALLLGSFIVLALRRERAGRRAAGGRVA
jgi:protein SCO1/2